MVRKVHFHKSLILIQELSINIKIANQDVHIMSGPGILNHVLHSSIFVCTERKTTRSI